MKVLLAVALAAIFTSGCGYQDRRSEYSKSGPLFLGFPGKYGLCRSDPIGNLSPEEWERPDFRNRIRGGMVEVPVNIPCILRKYNRADIVRYRAQSDPVASLAYVFMTYNGNGSIACRDIDKIKSELSGSYLYPSGYQGGPSSRVPESAFIMGVFQSYCEPGSEEFNALNLAAYDLGYDSAANRGPLLE